VEEEEEEEDRYRRVVERTMVQCSQCGSCTCSPLLYHPSVVTHFFLRTVRSKSEEASNNAVQYVGRTTLFFVVYVALFVGMRSTFQRKGLRSGETVFCVGLRLSSFLFFVVVLACCRCSCRCRPPPTPTILVYFSSMPLLYCSFASISFSFLFYFVGWNVWTEDALTICVCVVSPLSSYGRHVLLFLFPSIHPSQCRLCVRFVLMLLLLLPPFD